MDREILTVEYKNNVGIAQQFSISLVEQLGRLLSERNVTLGVPIESRVKDFDSLNSKLERKEIEITKVTDLDDFVGVRVILLFKRDLDYVTKCIKEKFVILHEEDKLHGLAEDKFGYQSRHYIVKVPDAWLQIPTFSSFGEFKAEIQVRTLAQHIWAAASHKLQYKHEKSVPPQLRRAINRASAILEVVDLEFERILDDREQYIASIEDENVTDLTDEQLNVESLKLIANKYLPPENAKPDDDFDQLFAELYNNNIKTTSQLIRILEESLPDVLKEDKELVERKNGELAKGKSLTGVSNVERLLRGVYFSHVGLIRVSVRDYLGDTFNPLPSEK